MWASYSIRFRMYALLITVTLFTAALVVSGHSNANLARTEGARAMEAMMLTAQKDKLQAATHTIALLLGGTLKHIADPQQQAVAIRDAVDPIRLEPDRSGTFFAYKNTTCVAQPANPELVGKDRAALKDKNGVSPVVALKDAAGSGGGFVTAIWPDTGKGDQIRLSYAEKIPGTPFWIGTGVNMDTVTAVQKDILSGINDRVSRANRWLWIGAVAFFFLWLAPMMLRISSGIVTPVRQIAKRLKHGADQVAAASNQVSQASQGLASSGSEQAASIEETSASLEIMASVTRKSAENTGEAYELMKAANIIICTATAAMDRMTDAMQDITQTSGETRRIVKTIDEIAFQTNLLALNAAVEAARAGEAGAGFAVVAGEVRTLAKRAAEAAHDTAELIDRSVKQIDAGAGLVGDTNTSFYEMAERASRVTQILTEISGATKEQAQGIEQITKAVAVNERGIQDDAASAEESAAASEELNAQAEVMRETVARLVALVEGGKAAAFGSGHEPSRKKRTPLSVPARIAERLRPSQRSIAPQDEGEEQDFTDF